MNTNHSRATAEAPVVPTRALRERIRGNAPPDCDCGAAELLEYVEFLEAELLRASQRLETLEARLSRNPAATTLRQQ